MLPIFVPSLSRWQRCLTFDQLGPAVLHGRPVYLVVRHDQREQYIALSARSTTAWGCRVPVLSEPGIKGIARTREFIGQYAASKGFDKFIMLDDDLRFAVRDNPEETRHDKRRLRIPESHELVQMLRVVDKLLDKYAHVAIRHRMAYHDKRLGYPVETCVRALRALAYRTKEFNLCSHGRVDIMEDFDVTLQLLAKGYPNAVTTHWVQDQSQTQAVGGCSDYRTHQLHQRNVRRMAALWGPEIVALREKNNKTGGEFGKRVEATIQWKRALGLWERQLIGTKS